MNNIRFPCKGGRAVVAMSCGDALQAKQYAATQVAGVTVRPPR